MDLPDTHTLLDINSGVRYPKEQLFSQRTALRVPPALKDYPDFSVGPPLGAPGGPQHLFQAMQPQGRALSMFFRTHISAVKFWLWHCLVSIVDSEKLVQIYFHASLRQSASTKPEWLLSGVIVIRWFKISMAAIIADIPVSHCRLQRLTCSLHVQGRQQLQDLMHWLRSSKLREGILTVCQALPIVRACRSPSLAYMEPPLTQPSVLLLMFLNPGAPLVLGTPFQCSLWIAPTRWDSHRPFYPPDSPLWGTMVISEDKFPDVC